MALTFVGASYGTVNQDDGSNSVKPNVISGVHSGDLLLMMIENSSGYEGVLGSGRGTVSTVTGYTQLGYGGTGDGLPTETWSFLWRAATGTSADWPIISAVAEDDDPIYNCSVAAYRSVFTPVCDIGSFVSLDPDFETSPGSEGTGTGVEVRAALPTWNVPTLCSVIAVINGGGSPDSEYGVLIAGPGYVRDDWGVPFGESSFIWMHSTTAIQGLTQAATTIDPSSAGGSFGGPPWGYAVGVLPSGGSDRLTMLV